ncbi:hypothetical protein Q1695_008951 [Nippostrongylus brasiliensis]|nr:hypothetical protein Q1695_008951 [Nippostrongylus brasiliensis]
MSASLWPLLIILLWVHPNTALTEFEERRNFHEWLCNKRPTLDGCSPEWDRRLRVAIEEDEKKDPLTNPPTVPKSRPLVNTAVDERSSSRTNGRAPMSNPAAASRVRATPGMNYHFHYDGSTPYESPTYASYNSYPGYGFSNYGYYYPNAYGSNYYFTYDNTPVSFFVGPYITMWGPYGSTGVALYGFR